MGVWVEFAGAYACLSPPAGRHPCPQYISLCDSLFPMTGAYAGFLRGGGVWSLDIHAAKRHFASSEAASRC